MFRLAFLSALIGSAASLKTNSKGGRELLSNSRKLEQDNDFTWIVDYSMKFANCHTITQYNMEGDEEQGNVYKETLIKYKLCKTGKCGYGCKGGEYLTDMASYIDAYTEAKMNAREYACEMVRENCNCEDDQNDDEKCEKQCYIDAGLDYCIENDDDGEEFNLQEFLECREIEDQNGGYYNQQYFVGPKCSSNGERINLAVFTDEFCTVEGPAEMYAKFYGETLPYKSTSIVEADCVECAQADGDDGAYEISEMCMEQYMISAKCESKLSIYNPDTSGCDFIDNLYLREDNYKPMKHTSAVGMAWFFFISTVGLAAVAAHLHMQTNKKIVLNENPNGAVV